VNSHARYGYRNHSRSHHIPRAHLPYARHVHSHYRRHGLHLNFTFGYGTYRGCGYYRPYYSYASRRHYAFFYPRAVTYCYAPYGFYYSSAPVYVTNKTYVRDDYASTDYADVTIDENGTKDEVEPEPAAGSPMTEKFLRDGSKAFHEGNYEEAAKQFRLAAITSPELGGPLFALGQALIALGKDDYALRVIRKAIELNPALVKEPGDIVGVYKDQAEFDKVLRDLETRAEAKANEAAPLLLATQRYFTGDPRSRADFAAAKKANADDPMIDMFIKAVEERFKAESDLPPIK